VSRKNNKNYDSNEDKKAIKSGGKKKKQRRKSKRHFDKDALRGIMDGTINLDAYQEYIEDEQ
jgi:hypothetical protein